MYIAVRGTSKFWRIVNITKTWRQFVVKGPLGLDIPANVYRFIQVSN